MDKTELIYALKNFIVCLSSESINRESGMLTLSKKKKHLMSTKQTRNCRETDKIKNNIKSKNENKQSCLPAHQLAVNLDIFGVTAVDKMNNTLKLH